MDEVHLLSISKQQKGVLLRSYDIIEEVYLTGYIFLLFYLM